MQFKRESELISPLVEMVEGWGFEVFTDQQFHGKMPDVLGLADKTPLVAIEAKLSDVKAVFYQALILTASVPTCYIAVPKEKVRLALNHHDGMKAVRNVGIIALDSNGPEVVREASIMTAGVNPGVLDWLNPMSDCHYNQMKEYKNRYGTEGGLDGKILSRRHIDIRFKGGK